MVNFGPVAAEISPVVWGTLANFNRFRILAALLHGTTVVVISQTGIEQRVPPLFVRAAITLGIGPHCSYVYFAPLPCAHEVCDAVDEKIIQQNAVWFCVGGSIHELTSPRLD